MIRGLIYKEIKERKLIIFLGILLCAAPFLGTVLTRVMLKPDPNTVSLIKWAFSLTFYFFLAFIYPVILTAGAIAGETESGTLNFLLSLPKQRWQIWLSKVTAIKLILISITGIYILLNPIVTEFYLPAIQSASQYIPMILLPLILPLYTMAVTLFTSSMARKEREALEGALFLTVLLIVPLPVFAWFLVWDMSLIELFIYVILITLTLSACSFRIFIEAEDLSSLKKKLKACILPASCGALAILLALGGIYLAILYPSEKSVTSVWVSRNESVSDKWLFAAIHVKSPDGDWNYDNRLWLLDKNGDRIVKLPVRYTDWSYNEFSDPKFPKDRLIIRSNPIFKGIFAYMKFPSKTYLIDLNSFRTRCISTSDYNSGIAQMAILSDNTIVAIRNERFRDKTNPYSLVIHDINGQIKKETKIITNSESIWPRMEFADGELFIIMFSYMRKSNPAFIFKYNRETESLEKIFEKSPARESDRIWLRGMPISPDGKRVIYSTYTPEEGNRVFIESFDGKIRIEAAVPMDGAVIRDIETRCSGYWLPIEDQAVIGVSYGGKTIKYLINTKTGKLEKELGENPYYYYNIGIYDKSGEKYAELTRATLNQKVNTWKLVFSTADREKILKEVELKDADQPTGRNISLLKWTDDGKVLLNMNRKILRISQDGAIETMYEFGAKEK